MDSAIANVIWHFITGAILHTYSMKQFDSDELYIATVIRPLITGAYSMKQFDSDEL